MNKQRQPDMSTTNQPAADSAPDSTGRQQIEKALRESEEKYRTLFNSIDEAVSTLDIIFDEHDKAVDWVMLETNPAMTRMTGWTSEIVGRKASEYIPDMEAFWFEAVERVVKTGEPVRIEHPVAGLNDNWYEGYIAKVGGEGSRQVVCVYSNITERKRYEASLAFLNEVSQDLIRLTNIDQTMNSISEKIAAYLGLSACAFAELKEQAQIGVINHNWHRSDMPSLLGTYRMNEFVSPEVLRACQAGEAVIIHDVFADPRTDGDQYAALNIGSFVSVPLLRDGEWRFLLVVYRSDPHEWARDEIDLLRELITRIWARLERARAEEALRESEQKFRLLSIASSDSIYSMNSDWTQMHQLTGKAFLPDTTDPDSSWLDVYIPLEDQFRVQQVIQEAIRTKSTFELEHRVRQADGTVGWTFSRAIPIFDAQGTIREWVGAASDITVRKQAQEALLISDRRKSEFLAMLAHELRNPLSTLHNTLLLLGITHGQDETLPLDKAHAMMSREVTHLNRMIDDLLDVSRISQGKIQLKKERLDLGKLVRDALEAARSQFASRQHTLTIQVPADPLWVNGDHTRLTQVVRNLATNAAKYTPTGGRIGVTLAPEEEQVVLRVRDSGIGIAAEQLKAIFEVFVQVSASLDRPQGGLGLGLAVVRQLVGLHGGEIDVHSPGLGQGSEFMVRLPALPDALPQPAPAGGDDGRTAKAGRILVVDDNPDLALTTAMLLRHRQYEAHTCLSGPDALALVESLQPAAVLLDLGMPDMDGFETCRRLRESDWGRQGVIVALSGYGQEDDKKRTRESGFDGHLVKPLNLQLLTNLLDELLKTTNRTGN